MSILTHSLFNGRFANPLVPVLPNGTINYVNRTSQRVPFFRIPGKTPFGFNGDMSMRGSGQFLKVFCFIRTKEQALWRIRIPYGEAVLLFLVRNDKIKIGSVEKK